MVQCRKAFCKGWRSLLENACSGPPVLPSYPPASWAWQAHLDPTLPRILGFCGFSTTAEPSSQGFSILSLHPWFQEKQRPLRAWGQGVSRSQWFYTVFKKRLLITSFKNEHIYINSDLYCNKNSALIFLWPVGKPWICVMLNILGLKLFFS